MGGRGRRIVDESSRNLTPERGPSVWNRQGWHGDEPPAAPRVLLGLAGVGLLAAGWRWSSVLAAATGVALVGLAVVDEGPTRAGAWVRKQFDRYGDDRVNDDSALSFPASDSPGWTATDGSYAG
jgi:hypothetical protein